LQEGSFLRFGQNLKNRVIENQQRFWILVVQVRPARKSAQIISRQ